MIKLTLFHSKEKKRVTFDIEKSLFDFADIRLCLSGLHKLNSRGLPVIS